MTRTFAYLAVALMLLAGIAPARATMDDDFFGFHSRQQQPATTQRGVPTYGPGSDYFGGGGSGPIPRERVSAPVARTFDSNSTPRLVILPAFSV